MGLKVDTGQLRKLASKLNETADKVDAVDVRTKANAITAALPGAPEISRAATQGGEFVEGAWLRLAQRQRRMASISTECANDFECTDEKYRDKLTALGATRPAAAAAGVGGGR